MPSSFENRLYVFVKKAEIGYDFRRGIGRAIELYADAAIVSPAHETIQQADIVTFDANLAARGRIERRLKIESDAAGGNIDHAACNEPGEISHLARQPGMVAR